jgi:hypothetical protein
MYNKSQRSVITPIERSRSPGPFAPRYVLMTHHVIELPPAALLLSELLLRASAAR